MNTKRHNETSDKPQLGNVSDKSIQLEVGNAHGSSGNVLDLVVAESSENNCVSQEVSNFRNCARSAQWHHEGAFEIPVSDWVRVKQASNKYNWDLL